MKKILIASFVVLLSHNVLYGALIDVPIDGDYTVKCDPFTDTPFWDPVSNSCVKSDCINTNDVNKNICDPKVMCFRGYVKGDTSRCLGEKRYVCLDNCKEDYVCTGITTGTTESTNCENVDTNGCQRCVKTTKSTSCTLGQTTYFYNVITTTTDEVIYCTSNKAPNTCYKTNDGLCKKCPDGAVVASDRNTNSISSCYLPSGKTYEDESGTFKLNGNCAYSGN